LLMMKNIRNTVLPPIKDMELLSTVKEFIVSGYLLFTGKVLKYLRSKRL